MLVWLSDRMPVMPVMPITIQQSSDSFSLNKFTRTMANENTQSVHLTAKEFDLLYLLFRLVLKEDGVRI